jgi:hypothetical protein
METVHALEIDGVCMPHTFVALCALFDKTQDGEYEVNVVEKVRLPRFPASFFFDQFPLVYASSRPLGSGGASTDRLRVRYSLY